MPNYKRMYFIVCAAASEAVEAIQRKESDKAADKLLTALNHAEEVYIESSHSTRVRDILCGVERSIHAVGPYIFYGAILLAFIAVAFSLADW